MRFCERLTIGLPTVSGRAVRPWVNPEEARGRPRCGGRHLSERTAYLQAHRRGSERSEGARYRGGGGPTSSIAVDPAWAPATVNRHGMADRRRHDHAASKPSLRRTLAMERARPVPWRHRGDATDRLRSTPWWVPLGAVAPVSRIPGRAPRVGPRERGPSRRAECMPGVSSTFSKSDCERGPTGAARTPTSRSARTARPTTSR